MLGLRREPNRAIAAAVISAFLLGCQSTTDGARELPLDPGVMAAKASGVSVTATDPSYGDQGQINESVIITGTGFAPGAQAAWLYKGVVDTTITVVSTTYLSSTQLRAVINISPKSPPDFRDVQVTNSSRTQGIGNLVFEVTQAVQIPGTASARSITDNGEVTGNLAAGGVFYFDIASNTLQTVSTTGTGRDISPIGNAIVGEGGAGGAFPTLWTRAGPIGTAWVETALPVDPTATSGSARAIVADPLTGQPVLIGGSESVSGGRGSGGTRPVLWSWQSATSTWQRSVLPTGGAGVAQIRHRSLAPNGVAGGEAAGPAVWTPDGAGGYSLTILSGGTVVNGVKSDGTMAVGFLNASSSSARYWQALPGGGWSGPVTIPGGCGGAKDISDAGRILVNTCPFGNANYPAFTDPPYTAPTRLGGLGPKSNVGSALGISHGGHYAAGEAIVGNKSTGVYWKLP